MFSRFQKNAATPAIAPASEKSAKPAPDAPSIAAAPAPEAAQAAPPSLVRRTRNTAGEQAEREKDIKRKNRLLDIRMEIHRRLLETLNLSILDKVSEQELRREIGAISREGLREQGVVLNSAEMEQLNNDLFDEVTGLGPLEPLLRDDSVNDILVNGHKQVFVERAGKLTLTDTVFKDEKHLLRVIDKIVSAVGRRVDESNPYVDARLTDGSRFNALVPPCAVDGPLVSIRKFKKDKLSVDQLIEFGAFTEEMAAYLQASSSYPNRYRQKR